MSDAENIQAFIKSVENTARLLSSIDMEILALAFKEDHVKQSVERCAMQRKHWGELLEEIAKDMRGQQHKLMEQRETAMACVTLARSSVALFNGREFKESIGNLDKFVTLVERLKALRDNGFLQDIVSTISVL